MDQHLTLRSGIRLYTMNPHTCGKALPDGDPFHANSFRARSGAHNILLFMTGILHGLKGTTLNPTLVYYSFFSAFLGVAAVLALPFLAS